MTTSLLELIIGAKNHKYLYLNIDTGFPTKLKLKSNIKKMRILKPKQSWISIVFKIL